MSEADKLFEKLGYENYRDEVCVLYRRKDIKSTCNLDVLDIAFYEDTENVLIETYEADVVVDKDELIAIAEKAKELGWL